MRGDHAGPDPLRQWARRALSCVLPSSMFLTRSWGDATICLTFDDGPHPEHTPRVLDALARHGVRATFFVVGENAARHPGLVKRIAAHGHEVANHSYTHPDPERISARALDEEARRTDALLEDLTGRTPGAFRPPRGKIRPGGLARLWARGQTVALWSIDPRDYEAKSADDLVRRMRRQGLERGDVILLHDIHPFGGTAVNAAVSDARARGLRFATVSEVTGREEGRASWAGQQTE